MTGQPMLVPVLLRRESVEAKLRARGHANAAKLVDQDGFPRPARIGVRSLRWDHQEVLAWLQANPGTGQIEPEDAAEKAAEAARASLAGALQQLGTRDPAELRQAAERIAAAVAAGAKLRKPDRMLVLSVADHATDEATWRSLCAAVAAGRGRKPRPWTSPLVCPPGAPAPRRRPPPAEIAAAPDMVDSGRRCRQCGWWLRPAHSTKCPICGAAAAGRASCSSAP